jgi:DNA helicase-2/ATP-dependent DNA helicase PcrA
VALSERDGQNIAGGKESVLDRTRQLFYVCCSRAVKDLAVVLFAPDVAAARKAIIQANLFSEAAIHGLEELA